MLNVHENLYVAPVSEHVVLGIICLKCWLCFVTSSLQVLVPYKVVLQMTLIEGGPTRKRRRNFPRALIDSSLLTPTEAYFRDIDDSPGGLRR